MNRAQFNRGIFLLEGLNALATSFYFNYLFFFLKSQYGFSNFQNLLVCALNGFIYIPCALYGGRFGQRHGYLHAVAAGLIMMMGALTVGSFLHAIPGLIVAMSCWTVGVCFTWPSLEALVCDKEPPARLPSIIGTYNVVWSAGGAIAYFTGGAIAETLGWRSIFWIPALAHLVQLGLVAILIPHWKRICQNAPEKFEGDLHESHPEGSKFLKMAWIANPFAYIAINATIPLIPDLATRLQLSPRFAGFFCSIWFFSRMMTFAVLAVWPGWHYRFRYLIASYCGMVFCFTAMLLLNHIGLIMAVQVLFGWCLGLIYYSSLYYSMHVGETKGEHGGVHEAVIGGGIFGGPAIGAASLYLFPEWPQSSVAGVATALVAGFAALLLVRGRKT
jgi:MFS family permease